ncbi:hypothetical protein MPTK1_2g11860 [Marchantia polymorpha subsp. ruderalis]|uniref:RING-type E3 ubiquitin transferase n=1 Tax=Marchantia polymorpha TaxID=3197 RepID=A0A2R6XCL7_MARPO|nr:hypothetical protein MARPO_0023s0151 [Marchantia polymorpha]BBN01994.1 hypothetical protein Mp_2g11860 [Marchantia polymorpha subsp. ruderalis]|eukprot:PTQ43856.1 hypothetical protein MARPO_0023s0151 [Marchantia polymorpha]
MPPPGYIPPAPVVHASSSSNNNSGGKTAFSPAVVSIIAVLGSAFLVVSYYRIFAKLCTRWQNRRDIFELEGQPTGMDSDANVSPLTTHGLEQSLIKKIPFFVFKTGDAFTADTDCPVCLSEFLDHQELRLLPKCAHAFHVACIDTWLSTHSTCPLCRAPIFPEDQIRQSLHGAFGAEMQTPPGTERMEFTLGDGVRFGPLGHERMSASPTLRGLLNYEDAHSIWIPNTARDGGASRDGVLSIDSGDDSRRFFDSRDAGLANSNRNSGSESRGAPGFSTPMGQLGPLTRTASCKESSHSRSRDRDHKWHIPPRRPSFRKNPFALVVRSYSMGASRRHVRALEFLDLDEFRSTQSKSPPEFFGATPASTRSVLSSDTPTSERTKAGADGAGPSSRSRDGAPPPGALGSLDSSLDLEKAEASIKSSSARGRSKSFRSPFTLKRSLSGGRSMFSFRMDQLSRGRIFSMDSPPNS